ncbi:MAG: hypothetical protein M3Q10_07550 [Chloroflexota bacterium]|nr:hypothetical protein [Chloroflexota bacterium]
MEFDKRDLALAYGGRTFAVRAYFDGAGVGGPGWRSVIIENRLPLSHEQAPADGPAACFAEAVRFLAGAVEAQAEAAAIAIPPAARSGLPSGTTASVASATPR